MKNGNRFRITPLSYATIVLVHAAFLTLSTRGTVTCPVPLTETASGRRCIYQVTSQNYVSVDESDPDKSPQSTLSASLYHSTRKHNNAHSVRERYSKSKNYQLNAAPLNRGVPFKLSVQSPPTEDHAIAVRYCAALAARTWTSTIEVRAKFYFSKTLGSPDILGDARPGTTWYVDGYLYPVAMAKSLLREDVNGLHYGDERFDIVVRLNARTSWYVGTDGKPRYDQYDLVTVCLHEVYHGLMISGGNLKIDKVGNGTYLGKFFSNIDRRFDAFLSTETSKGDCAIASYRGVERSLGKSVTGNTLWFRSSSQRVARLYAPPEFRFGSSVYHLSEVEYGDGNDRNSLMTPSMPIGYSKHSLGPLILRMQELMLNETEFGAPLCGNHTEPIFKDEMFKPRTGNNSRRGFSTSGCVLRLGTGCLGVGAIAGIAIGIVFFICLIAAVVWLIACWLPKRSAGRA